MNNFKERLLSVARLTSMNAGDTENERKLRRKDERMQTRNDKTLHGEFNILKPKREEGNKSIVMVEKHRD